MKIKIKVEIDYCIDSLEAYRASNLDEVCQQLYLDYYDGETSLDDFMSGSLDHKITFEPCLE